MLSTALYHQPSLSVQQHCLTRDVDAALAPENISSMQQLISTTDYIATASEETPLITPATISIVDLWLKHQDHIQVFEQYRPKIYSLLKKLRPQKDVTIYSQSGLQLPYTVSHTLLAVSAPKALRLYSNAIASIKRTATDSTSCIENTKITITLPYSSASIECIIRWIEDNTIISSISDTCKMGLALWAKEVEDNALKAELLTLSRTSNASFASTKKTNTKETISLTNIPTMSRQRFDHDDNIVSNTCQITQKMNSLPLTMDPIQKISFKLPNAFPQMKM